MEPVLFKLRSGARSNGNLVREFSVPGQGRLQVLGGSDGAVRMTGLAGFDQGDQGVEHLCVGDGDLVLGGGADDGSVDGFDFGAAAGVDVLEHGGLMAGVGFEGALDHGLGAVEVGGNALSVGDGDGFGNDGVG